MISRTPMILAGLALASAAPALAGPDYSPSKKGQYPSTNFNAPDVDKLTIHGPGSTGEIPNMTVGGRPLSGLLSAVPQIENGQVKFFNGPVLGTIGPDGKFTLTPNAVTAPSVTLTGPGLSGPIDSGTVGGTAIPAILGGKAPLVSPTFSGTVTAPAYAGGADALTIGGATLPSVLGTKAPLASPIFSGTVTAPILNVSGATSVGSLSTPGGVTAGTLTGDGAGLTLGGTTLPSVLGSKAPLASPTFSGTVTAPGISLNGSGLAGPIDNGTISGTAIPTLLGAKAPLASPAFTGTVTAPALVGDVSGSRVTSPSALVARTLAERAADIVRPEDYRLPGDQDDTASFLAAAETGRLLWLTDGKSYTLCRAVGVTRGVIGYGATIKPCASGFYRPRDNVTIETTGATQSIPARATGSIFYNKNWSASSVVDDGLSFIGFTVDLRGSEVEFDGEFHIIKARMARNVLVDGVTGYRGGDLVAFQATDGTVVRNSRGYLFMNAGIDHWEGPRNAVVENNILVCSEQRYIAALGRNNGPDGAVMFSAASGTLAARDGANLVSRGNSIRGGCNAGIFANILSVGGSLTNVSSDGDTIDAADYPGMIGMVIEGSVRGGRISGTTIKNGNGAAALMVRADTVQTSSGNKTNGAPSNIVIPSLRVVDWSTDAVNYSPITLMGTGHALNAMLAGGSNNTSVTVQDGTTSVSGTFAPKSSTYGPLNCLSGASCVVPGAITVGGTVTLGGVGISRTWAPTVSCDSGSLGANSAPAARYSQIGKQVTIRITHAISSFGTCANGVYYTLPTAVAYSTVGAARDTGTDALVNARILAANGAIRIVNATGGTPTTTGGFEISATYEVP